jgi:hypothetical protein
VSEVEYLVQDLYLVDRDNNGKPRYEGVIGGIRVRVVVAVDEPDLIVTIHNRRR